MKIGIFLGSARTHGNGTAIWLWVQENLKENGICQELGFDLVFCYPNDEYHPLGPVVDEVIPAMTSASSEYADEKVGKWSRVVDSCQAFIVLSPQYNWGYPGDLKNVFDHLYHEWMNKPVMLVTYGGHGGEKCGQQLRQVFSGLKMSVVPSSVSIVLPEIFIRTSTRVSLNENTPSFLCESKDILAKAIDEFKHLILGKNTDNA